jgi:hypothetical protein
VPASHADSASSRVDVKRPALPDNEFTLP